MSDFLIYGGKKLCGEVSVDSAKNAILPILAGCLLCDGEVELNNITYYDDVLNMLEILKELGAKVNILSGGTLTVDCSGLKSYLIPFELSNKLRASIFCLGPLTARFKKAKVAYPGGCAIGNRPIDIHLKALESLNIQITDLHGYITTNALSACCGDVYLNFPSVGATENIIMAACLVSGVTKIYGCAKEPEVVDLCNFLNCMGAKIKGVGHDVIIVEGVKSLHGGQYTPIPDRIIAGTFMMLPLITGGDVVIKHAKKEHIGYIINLLKNNSCNIEVKNDIIRVTAKGRLNAFGKIETMPYPFFPTDLQQQLCVLASIASGTTMIVENMFESRFKHVPELVKMGANISVKDRVATIIGVSELYGATVNASDLRGAASLVLAGVCAKGYTTVKNIEYLDRGYYQLEKLLTPLGADIKRV